MLLSIYGSALQHLEYLHSIGLGKSFDDLNKIFHEVSFYIAIR